MIYYIGHSSDLDDRINRHNSNRSKFTKNKGPWELVEFTACKTKTEAYQLEMKIEENEES